MTAEQLMEVRDRPLEAAYRDHDVGEEVITARLQSHTFEVVEHGDDARHADEVFFGDGPDLAVYKDGELVAYIEIKCKTDPAWFGRCNLRHYREYVNFANETDVPVFIWFALVDRNDDPETKPWETDTPSIHREAFIEVQDTDQIEGEVVEVGEETVVYYEEDSYDVDEDEGLCAIDGSEIVEVRCSDVIVDYIPEVFGNEVVELNDDDFRSWSHFLWVVEQERDDTDSTDVADASTDAYTVSFESGAGTHVPDTSVEIFDMEGMVPSDAVQRAKSMYAEKNDVDFDHLVGRKLTTTSDNEKTTVAVVEMTDDEVR